METSSALSHTFELDDLLAITDGELEKESGALLMKNDYLGQEIAELCNAELLTSEEEKDYGEKLPLLRKSLWDALRTFPVHQGALQHLTGLAEEPNIPIAIRCYREIKNVMERSDDEEAFTSEYGCRLEVAQEAHQALRNAFESYMEKRQQMFLANGRLVVAIARRLQGLGVSLNDLIHEGVEGLLHAIDRFSWSDKKFCSYAFPCVRGIILTGVNRSNRTITVKSDAVPDILALNREEALHATDGKVDDKALCKALGWTGEKLKEVRQWRKFPGRLDATRNSSDEFSLKEVLQSNESSPDADAIRSDCARHAREVIDTAIERVLAREMRPGERKKHERDVEMWRLHHTGEGLRHGDIANLFHMSVSNVKARIDRVSRLIKPVIASRLQDASTEE